MQAEVLYPKHGLLRDHIEYFLFLSHTVGSGSYQTYPNTNVCLAIYEQNTIDWNREINLCQIGSSGRFGDSRLFGYHRRPFRVIYSGPVRQICVLFRVGGLAFFCRQPVFELDGLDDPLTQIFGHAATALREELFTEPDMDRQSRILESYLLSQLNVPRGIGAYLDALGCVARAADDGWGRVSQAAGRLEVAPSTFYRQFRKYFGQSPQEYQQTVRFRRGLAMLLRGKSSMTEIAHESQYYDQSHFIRDMKNRAGAPPSFLQSKLESVQDVFLWSPR